jgi:hypothetical protein
MPRISEFYGISVYMYFNDHAPPHFHARYADDEATISIDDVQLLEGTLPRRARNLAFEWASLRQLQLRENWDRARHGEPLEPIDPLE